MHHKSPHLCFLAAAQLCQSSYLSLQLPHVVMGLGQNPNFVDYLTVGVPTPVEQVCQNGPDITIMVKTLGSCLCVDEVTHCVYTACPRKSGPQQMV